MFGNLPSYSSYCAAGVWVGEVPRHWEWQPARTLFQERRECGFDNEPLLSVTIGRGVIPQAELLSSSSKKDSSNFDKSKYKLVEPGDLVYNKMRAWQGAAGLSHHRGIVSPAYIIMTPRSGEPIYFHHILRTPIFAKEAERWSYGITSDQWSLRPEHFKMIRFPVPPSDEQAAIVKYLEHADARINKAIAAKRRLIALLDEERRALVSQAVTGGADWRGAPDSGNLPQGWVIEPFLRTVVERADYRGATPEKVDSGVTLVTAKNVRSGWLDYETSREFVRESDYPTIMRRGLPKIDDILLTMEAPLGNVALVDREDVAFAQRVVRFRVDVGKLRPSFAVLALNSPYFQDQLAERATGSTALGIKASKLPELQVALPPPSEQDRIVRMVNGATNATLAARARTTREVDLLNEFRSRLVADVVTGQVDVRAIAASLSDIDPAAGHEGVVDIEPTDIDEPSEVLETGEV